MQQEYNTPDTEALAFGELIITECQECLGAGEMPVTSPYDGDLTCPACHGQGEFLELWLGEEVY